MVNFTSNTYQMKREILTFSNKISKHLSKPNKKFSADMTYGMLASGSCLLTDVVEQLHEDTKKVNSVERLTRHLNNGTSSTALKSYLTTIRRWALQEPVIHIQKAAPIKEKVQFSYYRLAKGISGILSYTKEGIRLWLGLLKYLYS